MTNNKIPLFVANGESANNDEGDYSCDVLILGSGPAARAGKVQLCIF